MEALYRKYRPSTFSDVIGQEHIERTLKNAIEQNKVSHAYLFCGPRGTGKTTMARILAKALLCEKGPTVDPDGTCPECEAIAQGQHPDVYELDAASRTGVENVREEIISRVNYAPTRGAWKVYIIDEVHMLSTAAFNALLKTLEEPPGHVVFILCTTDPQKVPETIQSRCQRFDFHRISAEAIVSRLGAICVKEGVDFEGEALDLIAYRADGGMRNALTSLEQLMAFGGGHVTLEGAQNLLGSLDEHDLSEIVDAIGRRDAAACFTWVAHYVETGADLAQFVLDLSEHIRNLYLLSLAGAEVEIPVSEATRKQMVDQLHYFGKDRLARLLGVLGELTRELRASSNPRLAFEIALTRMVRPESDLTIEALSERVEELERRVAELSTAPAAQAAAAPQAAAPAAPQVAAASASSVAATPQAAAAPAAPQATAPAASRPPAVAPAPRAAAQPPATTAPAASSAAAPAPSAPAASAPRPAAPAATSPASAGAASQPAAAAAPASAPSSVSPTQMTASVDLSNPATLQRLWHAVTTALRKANPARGVLFMNAKVTAEADGQGIVVEFGGDNAFAYNAAQKTEVQQLLADTLTTVAGGQVPFRLAVAGNASAAHPASPVRPAQAAQPAPRPAAVAPARPAPATPSAAAATRPAAPAAPVPPAPDDDRVPLDVYEGSVPADAEAASAAAPPRPVPSAPRPVSSASSPAPGQPPAASAPEASAPPLAPPSSAPAAATAAKPASASAATGDDEAQGIVDLLTASFGDGVKFEELPE